MLSKKRVRTKLNRRTKSKRISKSRKLNKKRVNRVSSKQRGGVKRRRTKKSKKKSQKGGGIVTAHVRKLDLRKQIGELSLQYAQKKSLLDMLEQSPEQVDKVEQIIKQIQTGKTFEDAMEIVEATEKLPETYKTAPPFLENAPCKGLNEKDNNECSKFIEEESCIEQKPYSRGGTHLGTKQKCKWTPADN